MPVDPVRRWIDWYALNEPGVFGDTCFSLPFGPLQVRSNWAPLMGRLGETFVALDKPSSQTDRSVEVEVTYIERTPGEHGLDLPAEWRRLAVDAAHERRGLPEEFQHLAKDGLECLWRPRDLAVFFSEDGSVPARILFDVRRDGRIPLRSTVHQPVAHHRVIVSEIIDLVRALYLRCHGHFCMHAAAVEVGGRAAVVLGQSGSGKSTTALSLARTGARLLSDELVLLEAGRTENLTIRGLFVPPRICGPELSDLRSLESSLGRPSGTKSRALGFTAEQRLRADRIELPPAALFFLDGLNSGRSDHQLEPLPSTEAFSRLMAQLIDPMWARRKEEVFATVASLVDACPCFSLKPGTDLDGLAGLLLATLDRSGSEP